MLECSLDSPRLEETCSDWEMARWSLEDLISNRLPRGLREALRSGSDELQHAWVLKFRSRNPKKFCIWIPPLELLDDETGKGDPNKHRVRVCRGVCHYLQIHEWQAVWPDIDSAIAKARNVFEELAHLGIEDFPMTVDEVKEHIVELITIDESGLRRQADSSIGVSRRLLVAHAPYAPPRGIPVDGLTDRVREVEPAADQAAIDAACDELLRDGIIRQEESEFSNILTKKRIRTKRWCLGRPARETAANDTPDDFLGPRASKDFAEVHYNGKEYTFTKQQALVVSELWAAWENRTPALQYATLLTEIQAGKTARLDKLFYDHPAWGTIIIKGEKQGTLRLSFPARKC